MAALLALLGFLATLSIATGMHLFAICPMFVKFGVMVWGVRTCNREFVVSILAVVKVPWLGRKGTQLPYLQFLV